ncbi:GDSL-like Lipase/Acylhydrolase family protein [Amycolatopsis tolypomycina]|uniref:GDSL-like Lipase/Acylhydrolase family protein n=1 Tax=Amycolatopsis tolypomycina TaxID=208445 RepID=A0A1H5B5S5_9PSEU|nr:SGNH/GDSL hydrolase family protein [Amycolatopsis tolypomycina]SED49943.1 GDSL-like Lipase/Acylhydrolase family protein [Amycolatopsis tolypomycina]
MGFRRFLFGGAVVLALTSLTAAPASATGYHGRYLALGDSVAFGYRPAAVTPRTDYLDAANFRGYAEKYAALRSLRLANASCPGETTASMLTPGAQSNGCENSLGSPIGYRTNFPLHVAYPGTQVEYAVAYLRAHPDTRLVTITVGANDMFLCQNTTPDHCTSSFPAALRQVETRLSAVLGALRAHYRGSIVLVSYYSLDYRDATQVSQVRALDSALGQVARRYRGAVADGFTAFRLASLGSGGDPCAAGLLIALPGGGCDVHPSPAGHRVLASALAFAH